MIERTKRNVGPHIGIVRFNIFLHRMLPDGSLDPEVVDCSDLFKDHSMTQAGEFHVTGFDKWDCAKKVKEKLESLGK